MSFHVNPLAGFRLQALRPLQAGGVELAALDQLPAQRRRHRLTRFLCVKHTPS
jgi:hypothetical protein